MKPIPPPLSSRPVLSALSYVRGQPLRETADLEEVVRLFQSDGGALWVDLLVEDAPAALARLKANPTDGGGPHPEQILRDRFGFHPLAVEDSLTPNHAPKIDDHESYLFGILHTPVAEAGRVRTRTLSFFLGRRTLVTVHKAPLPGLDRALARARRDPVRVLGHDVDLALHALLDELVADFDPVADELALAIDALEPEALRGRDEGTLRRILDLKRRAAILFRVLRPQRDVIGTLARGEFPLVSKKARVYFRDVYDHCVRLHDLLESHRDAIASARDAYLASVNNRMNRTMQTLAAVTTVLLPLTVVTGIYGMNFEHMPELRSPYGYPAALGLMATISASLFLLLRKKRWL
ncbi:MAG TPA: magnesium/cobalt transporter CorA [Planctomycetota bacterium]|nr:magnesium/cobalt transporter CorA [Planctomycetota bacterium]